MKKIKSELSKIKRYLFGGVQVNLAQILYRSMGHHLGTSGPKIDGRNSSSTKKGPGRKHRQGRRASFY